MLVILRSVGVSENKYHLWVTPHNGVRDVGSNPTLTTTCTLEILIKIAG